MKRSPIFLAFLLLVASTLHAQVGINTTGAPPDASAGLDVSFNNKGLLPPRVALTAINSALPVTAPAVGLLVYNTAVAGTAPYNVMAGYYCWDGTKWTPVATPPGTNPGEMQYWNGAQWVNIPAGSNGQVMTFNGFPSWRSPSAPCGTPITVNHIAGAVAPVTKTVTYGTVTNIPGEPTKCWITSNLGADHQANSVGDATEASAGWYWQFNRKQGYKHDGTTRTPNTTWITSIAEISDWIFANDPCSIELGTSWHVPTFGDLYTVWQSGGWTDWNGPWNSGLKLHAAGHLNDSDGSLISRGSTGLYWSSSISYSDADPLYFWSNACLWVSLPKSSGFSVRCVRDY